MVYRIDKLFGGFGIFDSETF